MMRKEFFKVGDLVKVLTSKIDTDGDVTGVVVEVINVDKDNNVIRAYVTYWDDELEQEESFIEEFADDELELLNVEEKREPRKVIQISESIVNAECYLEPEWNLTALCNDGSIWVKKTHKDDWVRVNDIPQD